MTEWACGHDHQEQIWDYGYFEDPDLDPVGIPLLCFKHRKHEPCRPCLREEDMTENLKTAEDTFAAIQALLNHLMTFDGYDVGFQPPSYFNDEQVGKYLLGVFNEDSGTMDILHYLEYVEETDTYELRDGDPSDA